MSINDVIFFFSFALRVRNKDGQRYIEMGINKNLNFYTFIVDYGKKRYQVDPTVHKQSRNAYFAASWKVSGWKTPFRLEVCILRS